MEDQGEQSPQTFLMNNFPSLQPRRKQDDQCAFRSWIKAAAWTLENKNGNVHHKFKVEFSF